jgi:hypothetical protein
MNHVIRMLRRIVTDDYLDLYLLSAAALTFTALGLIGVSDIKVFTSTILALLAMLALSQVRSRRHFESLAETKTIDPFRLFMSTFPDQLSNLRANLDSRSDN